MDIVTFMDRWKEAYNLLGINVLEQYAMQIIMSNAQPYISSLLHMNWCMMFAQLFLVAPDIQRILMQGTLGVVLRAHHPENTNHTRENWGGTNPTSTSQGSIPHE